MAIATILSSSAKRLPRQERTPPLKGRNASRGQSPWNLEGLKTSGSSQYFAAKSQGLLTSSESHEMLTVVMKTDGMNTDARAFGYNERHRFTRIV